jgi:hypothetical protein
MNKPDEAQAGIIVGILSVIGLIIRNRDYIRTAIIASRIKEGSEIRLMSKELIHLSQEIVNRDRVISALTIELAQFKQQEKEENV